MTLYSVFKPSGYATGADPVIVPERFSWTAALFAPVWALVHRAWLAALGWLVGVIAIGALSGLAGPDAGVWLYVLLAAWFGFAAAQIRAAALRRRGFERAASLVAASADLAEKDWYARELGA